MKSNGIRRRSASVHGLIAACLLVLAAAPAEAQTKPLKVAVVDVQLILRDSKAAKSVRPQIETLRKSYEQAVRRREAELRKSSEELQRQRAILSPQAFAKKRNAYEDQARSAQADFQERKRELDTAFGAAMGKVQKALIVAAANIAKERDLDLVLPKSIILLSAKDLDITTTVLGRVDKALPSVRVSLPKGGTGKASTTKN